MVVTHQYFLFETNISWEELIFLKMKRKVLYMQIKNGQYKGGENDTAKLVGKQQKETRIDYII